MIPMTIYQTYISLGDLVRVQAKLIRLLSLMQFQDTWQDHFAPSTKFSVRGLSQKCGFEGALGSYSPRPQRPPQLLMVKGRGDL